VSETVKPPVVSEVATSQVLEVKPPIPTPAPSPEEAKVAWTQGRALFQAGDHPTAAAQLQIAAAGRTEDAPTHYLLGLALLKSGQGELAEHALERAAALDPHSTKTWINLPRVRMELDETLTALEAAESALTIDPLSTDALPQKGRALATLNRGEEAIAVLEQAHDAAPGNGQIANTLGYWLLQSGRPSDSLQLLESARDVLPNVSYVRNNLGVVYERLGRIDEAAVEYRAAVESGDSGGKAAQSLARLGSRIDVAPPTTGVSVVAAGPHGECRAYPRVGDGDRSSRSAPSPCSFPLLPGGEHPVRLAQLQRRHPGISRHEPHREPGEPLDRELVVLVGDQLVGRLARHGQREPAPVNADREARPARS
jgi:Flp pilus assembly protein TadD